MSVPPHDFRDVLLDVWREACRHIELTESLGSMARLLGQHMPLAALAVRELDSRRIGLHTVAVAPATPLVAAAGRTLATAADYKRWLTWCRRGDVGHRRAGTLRRAEWTSMIPGPAERDALIGPLTNREGPIGVLVLIARRGVAFTADHVAMVRALLEPLATALENDRRVRELKGAGEAAAADRQTLLARARRSPGSDTIVGADTGLRLVMERVAEAARTSTPILILGEPGSGKEVVARAIHTASPRAERPFIRVNCGALPRERVDAELFGSGAGADDGHHGWVQRAAGGTLFLDEIAELPVTAQSRLVDVLARGPGDGERDGDSAAPDVRLVAATDQDLASLVREGRFRQDLWYRLATFPLLLPPLRERSGDIPALARHLAQRAAVRFGVPQRTLTADDLTLLMAYAWPGNVRELAAVIDRAVLLGRGDRLEVGAALGPVARAGDGARAADRAVGTGGPSGRLASLDEAMRQHIEAALALTEGRIEGEHGAARLLKINPHTLRSRMRKLRIEWSAFRTEP